MSRIETSKEDDAFRSLQRSLQICPQWDLNPGPLDEKSDAVPLESPLTQLYFAKSVHIMLASPQEALQSLFFSYGKSVVLHLLEEPD